MENKRAASEHSGKRRIDADFKAVSRALSSQSGEREALKKRKCEIDLSPPRFRPNNSVTVSLDRLASAIAPSVHGLTELKKGLLLMLLGGVPKASSSNFTSRGNIHICLLGDPATAKSTLLRWISSNFPRSVYTAGASSTSAGLTSALVSDGVEKVIKPGALVMAAGGVCCIDGFEQLGLGDQNAVREVMDQQTVTITKAGILTKLKADTSVLAACLHQTDCFDSRRALRRSTSLPDNVMQCFDLIYDMQDMQDSDCDAAIARHILASAISQPRSNSTELSLSKLQHYINVARSIQPTLSNEARDKLKAYYGKMRERGSSNPRQLESLIRLSEAVARGKLIEDVTVNHVDEAFQIMEASMISSNILQSMSSSTRARCKGA